MLKRQILFNIFVPAIAGIVIFIYIFYGKHAVLPSLKEKNVLYLTAFVIGAFIGLIMNFLDVKFKSSWNENINIASFIGLQLSLKAIFSILIVGLGCWITLGFTETFNLEQIWSNYYDEALKLIILTLGSILIYSLISFALQSYNYYAFSKIDRLRQERKQTELQYEALKSQLSPHYLFNCLNTISALIHKDARQTEDFIRRMAKTFQYVLKNDHKKLILISEEVEFVKAYNYLLKVRFENQLILNINLPKSVMEGFIPPLTLQMLLENVVKHNIIDDKNKVTVNIFSVDDHQLIIENNKTTPPALQESFQIGLSNIKKRFQHLTKDQIKIKDNISYRVTIPVLYKSEEVHE